MSKSRYPATLQVHLPKQLENGRHLSNGVLPPNILQERLPFGKLYSAGGSFGYCSKQEIQYPEWVIGKLHFYVKGEMDLTLSTAQPMVAILCILEGGMQLDSVVSTDVRLLKGEFGLVYIPSKINFTSRFQKGNYTALYISFSTAFFSSFIDLYPGFRDIYHKQINNARDWASLPFFPFIVGSEIVEKIRDCPRELPARKLFLQNVVNEILLLYFKGLKQMNGNATEVYNKDEEKLRQIAAYIAKKYNKPLTIEVLAGMATMNITSLERKFKKLYGSTPKEYLLSCRMKEAARLLKESRLSASEISYQVGFTTAKHFSETFKRYYYCSPLQYRNKETQQDKELRS
jgi:AraC-like DNA-binding protein